MPGFLGEISENKAYKNFGISDRDDLINEVIESNNFYLERRTIKKFKKDKVFTEDDEYIIITEGVILNSLKLIEKYKTSNFKNAIISMYRKNGETFFEEFRGSFSGLFYDKKKDKWIIYTNHIGDKQIFYYKMRDRVIFGSEINYLVSYMKNNKISYTFDEIGAYFILTYSYMLEDYTLFKEIKKLNAGKYIKIDNNKFEVKTYYEIDNTPNHDQTEDEIIENIDRLFRNAIELEFEKDKEYNYKHVVTLSGGLDSRMTSWVAHDMGYKDQLNVTFSQTDYLDEKIAKEIARDLKHEWLFKALDNGNFLKNIEDMIKINFGNCLYSGNAHVESFIKTFNFNSYGLYHTGQTGEIVKGYIYQNRNNNLEYRGAYSKLLFNKIDFKNINTYKNEGIFRLKNIPFNGTLQGNLPVQNYTEVISPFLDPDLIDYALQIPDGYKENELFIKWILKKYPGAAKYKWEAINGKITDKTITIMGRTTTLKALPRKVINKIFHKSAMNTKKHMNPFDYWYRTNENLKNFIDSTFKENISLLENNELKKDCQKLFTEGNTFEKTQVLTLLAAYKYYFGENNAET
ncbi:MAG: asparagine synthase [Defluviitoga tunisiensis]